MEIWLDNVCPTHNDVVWVHSVNEVNLLIVGWRICYDLLNAIGNIDRGKYYE